MADRNKKGELVCMFCGKTFDNYMMASHHEQTDHEILYIKVEKGELWKLVQFIYKYGSKEPELNLSKLISRFNKYLMYKPEKINYLDETK